MFISAEPVGMISVYFGHSTMSSEIKGSRINLLRQASIARSIDRWLILSAYCGDVLAEMHSSGI